MSVDVCDNGRRERLIRRINELYHDLQSDQFDELHRRRHAIERRFWESEVVPRLAVAGFQFGVDLCTGTGFVPRILLKHLDRSVRVLCMDVSDKALAEARSLLCDETDRIDWHVGDVRAIPLADGSADWVTLNAGLHHLPAHGAVLKEIDRVLKPGGYFCLGYEPNAMFFSCRTAYFLERTVWHLFWYLSPKRNWLRIRRLFHAQCNTCRDVNNVAAINGKLLTEGIISEPLSSEEIRRLVDVHAQEDNDLHRGFVPSELIQDHFRHYGVEVMYISDHGGEMLRSNLWLRAAFDGFFRLICSKTGVLFSFVIRKPLEGGAHNGA